jgi:hypothetical protein
VRRIGSRGNHDAGDNDAGDNDAGDNDDKARQLLLVAPGLHLRRLEGDGD